MVEMTVALVGILVIFAGLLTLARLGNARTALMLKARDEAGQFAMADAQVTEAPNPQFILDWTPGPDQRKHSSDDRAQYADPSVAIAVLVNPSKPDLLETYVPDNNISELGSSAFMDSIGLVHARATSNDIPLMPVVRHLIYNTDELRIDADVTMTWSRGIN